MQSAAARQNPAFDIYRADGNRTYSSEFEPTGDANTGAQHGTWFSNPDLQAAIHAPNQTWEFCTTQQVFPNGDASAPAVESVLPGVIEASSSGFIVAGGGQDALVITNGTLLGIQNMTWGGAQGLSTPPTTPLIGKDGQVAGSFTTDRNLTFAEIPYS
jgi:carboxypeptidase D